MFNFTLGDKLFRWAELSTERLHFLCEVLRITLTTYQYRVRFIGFCFTFCNCHNTPFAHLTCDTNWPKFVGSVKERDSSLVDVVAVKINTNSLPGSFQQKLPPHWQDETEDSWHDLFLLVASRSCSHLSYLAQGVTGPLTRLSRPSGIILLAY